VTHAVLPLVDPPDLIVPTPLVLTTATPFPGPVIHLNYKQNV